MRLQLSHRLLVACGTGCLFIASSSDAQLSVTETTSIAGSYHIYAYAIQNTGTTALVAFSVDVGIPPVSVTGPAGWDAQTLPISYRRVIQWVTTDPSKYLQPGASLSGFSIESSSLPGDVVAGAIDKDLTILEDVTTQGPAFLPSQFANISTRLSVGTRDNVLIGGFIITGTQTKTVLIRGLGPSLGLTNALADPTLELHDSTGALIDSNDNWQDFRDEQSIIDSRIPPSNMNEAAIWKRLTPGAYTTILKGANGESGIGLIEVYDLDRLTDSKLANISTRGFVQTGDDVMIGGIIISGTATANTLVRAIGPSLPLAGTLTDPILELHDLNGTLIGVNDNWKDSQQSEIQATGIAPTKDAEAAILRTLAPGAYTAIVRGKNGSKGIALIEAYQLGN